MDKDEVLALSKKVLSAWNEQDVEKTVACYTEDCVYLDPNTRGPVERRDALRRYLGRLFQKWTMTWTLKEFHPFGDKRGGAFLWRATLTPAAGGPTAVIDGMDFVQLEGDRLKRNEVYFDRMALFTAGREAEAAEAR
jgi:ketosteroid isomerase-like protein